MADPDRQLVNRLLAGEERAFQAFFDEHYPKLVRFAARRLDNDLDAAEDAAQATLCRALDNLASYRGEATLFTWLCATCRREIASRRRLAGSSERQHPLREDDPEVRAALETLLFPERDDPEQAASSQQLKEAVLIALDYLPAAYASILEWKYVHGLPVVAIAERLGRSAKATESMLTRARDAFRESFEVLYDTSSHGVPD